MSSAEDQAGVEAIESIRRWLALRLDKFEVVATQQVKAYAGSPTGGNSDLQIALALTDIYQSALKAAKLQRTELR